MFEGFRRQKNESEKVTPLTGREFLAKNLPGTDTYDDGLNEKGKLVMPGSTSTEAGDIYMIDKGPNDLRHRSGDHDELGVIDPEVTITDDPDQPFEEEDDEAAKWLKANDPKYKH